MGSKKVPAKNGSTHSPHAAFFGPLAATLGVGTAFASAYALKKAASKDAYTQKESKKAAICTAVATGLAAGVIGMAGLTAYSVLPLAGVGLGLKMYYKKNESAIKQKFGRFLNAATAGIFQNTKFIDNLVTA